MNSIPFYVLLIVSTFLLSCSSSKVIKEYKNPNTSIFQANKVLIIGMTSDKLLRRSFEKKISETLEKNNIITVKSIDFFEKSFTNKAQTIGELNRIEEQLLDAGFDAILLTKVTKQETKQSLVGIYDTYIDKYLNFEDYYYRNQSAFFNEEQDTYIVYFIETTLYCICPGKERELLWQGNIEVLKKERREKNIKDYAKILLKTLKENQLLL